MLQLVVIQQNSSARCISQLNLLMHSPLLATRGRNKTPTLKTPPLGNPKTLNKNTESFC